MENRDHPCIPLTPNDFTGSDSERINLAVAAGASSGRRVVIPRVNLVNGEPGTLWLLDSAICVPANTTLELQDCHIKLSDRCRDNFIRSSNCGLGIADVETIGNIHILGSGNVLLEGADRPRSTGDSAKTLGARTFGTDAGVEGEHQNGDWRNIGILMAHVEHFTLENLRIKDSHCWAISLERCGHGRVHNIDFASTESKLIDGAEETILNQDGLDLRQGCHDITIDGITGYSGDDLVAFTGIAWNDAPSGSLASSMITQAIDRGHGQDDVRHIILRNVRGHSKGGHHIVRFLNAGGIGLHDIVLDGVVDTSGVNDRRCRAALKIGDTNPAWGGMTPLGDTCRITISNIISRAQDAILIGGSITESTISNVIQHGGDGQSIHCPSWDTQTRNLHLTGVSR